ncbi:curlin minor subunit CsgB, partial [Escherichia coli]|nr:curlin minor subunit CsgB [Escherichia coli]
GGTADRNRSHWSTSKTPSYTKSVSWQHHPGNKANITQYGTQKTAIVVQRQSQMAIRVTQR